MAFADSWDETLPPDTRAIALGAGDITEFKRAIRERLAVDHDFLALEGADTQIGMHKQVSLIRQAIDPLTAAGQGFVYEKLDTNNDELFYKDSLGNVIELTKQGGINLEALYVSGQTIGDLLSYNGTKWTRLASGASGTFLKSNGAGNALSWATPVDTFNFVASAFTSTGALVTCSTAFSNYRNVAPTTGDGNLVMSLNYTPAAAGNILYVDVVVNGLVTGNNLGLVSLFRDTTLATAGAAYQGGTIVLHAKFSAASTSQTTFKVYAGANIAPFYFNGTADGLLLFAGNALSCIRVQEVKT